MKKIAAIITLSYFVVGLIGQEYGYKKSDEIHEKNKSTVDISMVATDWFPQLIHLEAPFPGTETYRNYLELLKSTIPVPQNTAYRSGQDENGDSTACPILLHGFEANPFRGIPNDNDVAISNNGMLVSAINSMIEIYDTENDSLIKSVSLDVFVDSLGLIARSFDPKVVYDMMQDRFILVFLNGYDATNTNIIVCFSESNDPSGLWNVYALEGNPFNDNTWTDYPAIALTQNELFITANLLHNDSTSWQTGFSQSIIWQVNTSSGYDGNTLETALYSDITFDGKPIRNICPIQGGSTLYGPNIFLLSNRNFDLSNDTIFLIEVTNEWNHTSTELTVAPLLSSIPYGLAPNANQPNTVAILQTNDSRVLGGFYEMDELHFVGNSINHETGLPSFFYGMYDTKSAGNEVDLYIPEDANMEFGYPNVSYSGRHDADMQSIITFNHSSLDSFPGVSAIFYSRESGFSDRLHIVSGNSHVDLLNSDIERWGDYTGSQRKYNEPGIVWMSGFKGTDRLLPIHPGQHAHTTWVSKLASPGSPPVPVSTHDEKKKYTSEIYPNPAVDFFHLNFIVPNTEVLSFLLVSSSGQEVAVLMKDRVKKGENQFRFSTQSLPMGTYFMQVVRNNGEIIAFSKLIKNE